LLESCMQHGAEISHCCEFHRMNSVMDLEEMGNGISQSHYISKCLLSSGVVIIRYLCRRLDFRLKMAVRRLDRSRYVLGILSMMTWIVRFGATYCFTTSVFVAGMWMVQVPGPGLRPWAVKDVAIYSRFSCGYLCCIWLFIILFYLPYRSCVVHL